MFSIYSGVGWGILIGLCVVVTAIIGLLALLLRKRGLAEVFVVAAAITLLVVAWRPLERALGLRPVPPEPTPIVYPSFVPIVRSAEGEASARIDAEGEFSPRVSRATCAITIATGKIASVEANDLGDLNGHPLRAQIGVFDGGRVGVTLNTWVPTSGGGPFWNGPGDLVSSEPAAGRVSFARIGFVSEYSDPADERTRGWPAELSGEISWSCGASSSASPVQP